MGYLDYAGLQYLWGKLKEKFAPKSHSHDDRYYTESEMDGKLSSKVDNNEAGANGLFSKLTTSWTATPTDNTYFIRQDTGGGNEFGRVKFSTLWNYIKGKTDGVYQPKGSYAASGHTHDDRYYTESEMNAKLDGKLSLSGGTLSGNIHFADIGNAGTSSGITWDGSTDGAGIYYQTTGADQGNLVLNLTDDYNCYLRIAQNGNFKSYFSPNDGNFHGNVNGTADVANVANFAKETYINQYKTVNLTDLDQNTWYPITGTGVPYNGLRHFKCNVQLNSGSKPSWSTHSSGFTAVVDILEESSGWGTTRMLGEVLINDQYFIADENKPPVGYQQMSYGSVPVWWLRGGGTYFLAADCDCTWTIQKSKYENSGQSVAPTTTYPGVNVNRATITANLEGNAKTATTADSANSLSGLSSRSSQGWGVQTGTFIHGEGDTTGGDFAFRRDCPNAGQISMVLDGRFYQNKGQYRVLDESDKNQFATAGHTHNSVKDIGDNSNTTFAYSKAGMNYGDYTWLAGWNGYEMRAVNKNQFAITGHTHTKDQVGLGNVDNTADANKSVKYATSAGNADSATTSNGVKDYNDANRTIKIGFAGAGLTAENLNYVAGYTDNGTKIKDVSKDVLKSWIGLGNYLPLIGGTMSGQITKSTGGSWIGDRDRAAIKSSYAGDSSYGAVAAMATKNGYWTMGNLGGNESLIFNYSTDANYNAGKNEASQVYLPAQAGTIITSATIGSQSVNYANSAGSATSAGSVAWGNVSGKPSTFTPASHTHDDRYYTESEVNTKLANYQPKGNYAAASHTHNYAGSGSAGGSANSAVKLDSSAGSATQPVYFKDGKPVATTYTLNKTVPADAKFTDTNTWRGIQNNLTSDSTDQSLSAAQGKALKTLVDGKAPISHTHKKSQITDFPSSMPASDVYAWAKAATKPSYTKAEVGLGNVDNTADKNKSVNYATSAGLATNAQCLNNDDKYMKFHWSGQKGQPTWLWGGNDSGDMYVYNPSNFNVNYATTAGNGTVDFQTKVTTDGYFGAVRFGNGVQICWFTMKSARNRTFLLPFADINYAIAFSGGYCWLNINNRTTTGFTVGVEWSGYENSYIAIGRWK